MERLPLFQISRAGNEAILHTGFLFFPVRHHYLACYNSDYHTFECHVPILFVLPAAVVQKEDKTYQVGQDKLAWTSWPWAVTGKLCSLYPE